jgi:hypothetical protein
MVAFLGALFGVPMPDPDDRRDSGMVSDEDFPCRGHSCGCLSAEMCRNNCCCNKTEIIEQPAKSCCSAKKKKSSGSAFNALSCKGITLSWVTSGSVIVVNESDYLPIPVAVGTMTSIHNESSDSHSLQPAIPPPRATA